jgi:hypothetical protein
MKRDSVADTGSFPFGRDCANFVFTKQTFPEKGKPFRVNTIIIRQEN